MNCDGVRGLLSAYLDGELLSGELLRVEQHLRRCHACADEVDSLRQTIALVASLDEVEVPATFHAHLHERLVALGPPVAAKRRVPGAPAWQRNVGRWAVPAAAAAAALAIGLTSFTQAKDRIAEGINGGTGQFVVDNETPTTAVHQPAGGEKQVAFNQGGGDPGTANPIPSGPKPSSGGNDNGSTVPQNPEQNQPYAGYPPRNPGAAYGVTDQPFVPTTPPVLEPEFTHAVTVSVAAESKEALSKALAGYSTRFDAASVIATVPAEKRQAFLDALRSSGGVKLTGEAQETVTNLAEQIYQETALRDWNQQELEKVEKQIPRLTDAAQREESLALQKALQEKLQRSETTLQILNSQVGKAFITVYFRVSQ